MTQRIDTLIIGAGQAGLSASYWLSKAGIDHVVLDRGRIGQRWLAERWPSLTLLTPNWMNRLPGAPPPIEPNGFMPALAFAATLRRHAEASAAPVIEHVEVLSVSRAGGGYSVVTSGGVWRARQLVIATGACDLAHVPAWSTNLSTRLLQLTPDRYRDAADLPPGGVLIVGASATGVQLALEIQRTGRPVTLAVGRHVRAPRSYRGRDIFVWLAECGFLDDAPDAPAPHLRAQPSLQLSGRDGAIDLHRLSAMGARITGRALAGAGMRVFLDDDLQAQCAASERRRLKVLARIDTHIAEHRLDVPEDRSAHAQPAPLPAAPCELDLAREGINTIVWATGFRRSYPWLRVPVLDADGEIVQEGGVSAAPGLYALGLPFMRRRASSFIHGAAGDALAIATHIAADLQARAPEAA